jgi:nuclear protein localization protein 4 homolog
MILRFVSRDGQFRLTVEPHTTFTDIIPRVAEKLPKNIDIDSITVSNKRQGGDSRKLSILKGVTFDQVGLR